ncbi:TIGR04168 family protein [Myxosarcina sp. GI1]|uniref:TIGR04168 family protein n=1 Tax=Myxosarcina sp. GI1 TaxID=1541065 RepID=UPI0005600066|nr:TIGR04168 family protein [Myxosarcina sp. GI1]
MSSVIDSEINIAVVGDIHDLWDDDDELALKHLGVDLVLFVGDFGNESVDVVKKIAAIKLPIATIMGNHDAWYTASHWGRKQAPYDRNLEDRVQRQLDFLGNAHVGFSYLDFPQFDFSVVGSRPFSWGGKNWKNADFYRDRYDVNNFAESTARIVEAVQNAAFDTVIFIGHNGPFGLGDKPEDICGKDWQIPGGDYGDPDLAEAISKAITLGKSIPFVTFGHMHHRLRHRQDRLRTRVVTDSMGTIYFNSASVPRLKQEREELQRNFSLVSLKNGIVERISLIWLGQNFALESEEILYQKAF